MSNQIRFSASFAALLLCLALTPSTGGSQSTSAADSQKQPQGASNGVYICACLKTKSCSCMTEAKMEGRVHAN